MKKNINILILMLTALILFTPIVCSTPSTTIISEFTVENTPPSILAAELYESDEQTFTTQITPQTEYALKITVSDSNTLQDISEITVIIFYDTDSNGVGIPPSTDSPQQRATYTWTPSGGWRLTGPLGSSWTINGTGSRQPTDLTAITGDWWLHFTPAKTAHEAGGTTDWDITIKVKDSSGATAEIGKYGYAMNWYGEITANAAQFSFGTVSPGIQNKPIEKVDGTPTDHIAVTVTANGNYRILVKADSTWTTPEGYQATLDIDNMLDDGEFELYTSVNGTPTTKVVSSSTTVQGWDGLTGPTSEAGSQHTSYWWITLAPDGLMVGTYTGTITYVLSQA